jgi:hypothetical protein
MTTKARIEISAEDRTRQAFASVERNLSGMQAGADKFARILGGLGGVLSAGAFVAFARTAISSAAALDDMAEATGASVEGLSRLTDIARIGGQDIGQVETAMVRLTKALAGSDDESKGAGAAFKALGLTMEQLQNSAPDQALEAVARAFAKFEDGAGKTAAALAIFGKSGAQLLPLLKDIAEQSERVASLTGEQAAQAEKLEKNFAALSVSASNYARSLISDLVPALNKFFETANKAGVGGALDATLGYSLRKKLGIGDKNIQAEIRQQQDKLDEMEEKRAKSSNPFARASDTDVENLRNYITGLKEVARIEALAGAGAPYGNEARKPQLPFVSPPDRAAKAAKAAKVAGLGDEVPGFQDESVIRENERLAKLADSYRALADPLQKYRDQLNEIALLREKNLITVEAATEAEFAISEAMDKTLGIMEKMPQQVAETDSLVKDLGLTFTSAFEEAIVGGKKLSEVLRSLGQDLLAIVARKAVTEPLGGMVSGLLGDIFKGFRAGGGPVSPGGAYMVGERGPELFVPRSAGSIVPGGGAVAITLNVSTGVQGTVRAELLNLLPSIQQATVAAVADARLRGATV